MPLRRGGGESGELVPDAGTLLQPLSTEELVLLLLGVLGGRHLGDGGGKKLLHLVEVCLWAVSEADGCLCSPLSLR
jgi:hypothetical protein